MFILFVEICQNLHFLTELSTNLESLINLIDIISHCDKIIMIIY